MLEGWEIAEATRKKAAEFGRKCDWCKRRVITHIVVGNKQRSSMVCDHCYRKKNVKEIEGATTIKKKPHRWANGSKKKKRAIFESK
jgi:hypothetical protein